MGSKTISLEDSAYHKLRAAKRPGESFSEAVLRILGGKEPSLLDFRGLLDKKTVQGVREAIAQMEEEDLRIFKRRLARGR
jgi:predicted CopG family antitoxin